MKSIKIDTDGSSKFQYPHFLVDVLMIEIDNNVFDYDVVYRIKDLRNTIGNFDKIYEEVMEVKNIEISSGINNYGMVLKNKKGETNDRSNV